MAEQAGTWTLAYGIWRDGSITSRDTGFIDDLQSEQEAQAKLNEIRNNIRSWGYTIWFSEIKQKGGKEE